MSQELSESHTSGADAPRPSVRIPARLHAVAVTALTVFFVGLVVWRVPIEGYQVESVVGYASVDGAGQTEDTQIETRGRITTDIVSSDNLRQAIRRADVAVSGSASGAAAVTRERIERIKKAVQLDFSAEGKGETRISLTHRGPNERWSLAFVDQLAHQFVVGRNPNSRPDRSSSRSEREARWRAEQARHYERQARFELDNFLQTCFDPSALGQDAASPDGPESSEGQTAAVNAGDRPELEINPRWQRLQTELESLTQRADSLLGRFTASHPQVQDVAMRIEETRNQLKETPHYLGSDPDASDPEADHPGLADDGPGTAPRPGSESDGVPGSTPADSGTWASISKSVRLTVEDRERFADLQARYVAATRKRETAEESLQRVISGERQRTESAASVDRWVVSGAAVIRQMGGQASGRRVAILGLVGIGCGLLMAWVIGTLGGLKQLVSVDDVRRAVALPIVAELPIDPAPPRTTRLAQRARLVRWATFACEGALGVLLLLFLADVVAGSPLFERLADDPLGTFANTVAGVCQQGW